jgi:hypothetical protein
MLAGQAGCGFIHISPYSTAASSPVNDLFSNILNILINSIDWVREIG